MSILLIGIGVISSVLLMHLGITFIKKADDGHGLPENIGIFYIVITVIAGCIVITAFYSYFFLYILFTAYLAIMAYTDFYTMKLYTIFHILIGMIGYIALFIVNGLLIREFILGLILIFFMRLAKVINTGDVELLFTSFPYICVCANIYKIDKLCVWFGFLMLVLFVSVVINLKAFIKKGKTKAPFAVPVFIGYVVMALLMVEK